MGLICSYDAFKGGYGDFNRLRQAVCRTLDGSYPPHYKYGEDGKILKSSGLVLFDETKDINKFYLPIEISKELYPGLWEFLTHEDYKGSIKPAMCKKVANELETLVLPNIEKHDIIIYNDINWSCKDMLIKFIKECREAHKEKRSLLFR